MYWRPELGAGLTGREVHLLVHQVEDAVEPQVRGRQQDVRCQLLLVMDIEEVCHGYG